MFKLGFDIDGVVAKTDEYLKEYMNSTYDLGIKVFKDYRVEKHPAIIKHKDRELIEQDLNSKLKDINFYMTIDVDSEAASAIRDFKKQGHKIYFISKRPLNGERDTALWLRKNHIPYNLVKHTTEKLNKGMFGRSLNLDFYIDDLPQELELMLRYKNRWSRGLFLLDKPWNKSYILDKTSKVKRVKSWIEVRRHLGINNR